MFTKLKKRLEKNRWNILCNELIIKHKFCDLNKDKLFLIKYVKLDKNSYNLIVIRYYENNYRLIISYPHNSYNKGISLLATTNIKDFIKFTKLFIGKEIC